MQTALGGKTIPRLLCVHEISSIYPSWSLFGHNFLARSGRVIAMQQRRFLSTITAPTEALGCSLGAPFKQLPKQNNSLIIFFRLPTRGFFPRALSETCVNFFAGCHALNAPAFIIFLPAKSG